MTTPCSRHRQNSAHTQQRYFPFSKTAPTTADNSKLQTTRASKRLRRLKRCRPLGQKSPGRFTGSILGRPATMPGPSDRVQRRRVGRISCSQTDRAVVPWRRHLDLARRVATGVPRVYVAVLKSALLTRSGESSAHVSPPCEFPQPQHGTHGHDAGHRRLVKHLPYCMNALRPEPRDRDIENLAN